MANQLKPIDTLFHALGDPTRCAVVERLTHGPASVRELAEPFDMALPSFMKHLGVLENNNIITSKKVGRVRTCTLQPASLETIDAWLKDRRRMWATRMDALENYLDNEQQN